jgi:RHS repeat-associated protein
VQTRYLFGPDVNELLAQITSSGDQWLLTDRVGSVRDVVNSAGTLVLDHTQYQPFGGVASDTAATAASPYGREGERYSRTTGMLQSDGIRPVNTQTDQWMGPDPSGFNGGDPNLRRAEGNDPTNATDPSGLRPIEIRAALYIGTNVSGLGVVWLEEPYAFYSEGWYFHTDYRSSGGSLSDSRIYTVGTIDTNDLGDLRSLDFDNKAGPSRRRRLVETDTIGNKRYEEQEETTIVYPTKGFANEGDVGGVSIIQFSNKGNYPLIKVLGIAVAPNIEYAVYIKFETEHLQHRIHVSGHMTHSWFPDAELWIDQHSAVDYLTPDKGPTTHNTRTMKTDDFDFEIPD